MTIKEKVEIFILMILVFVISIMLGKLEGLEIKIDKVAIDVNNINETLNTFTNGVEWED